MKFKNVSIIIIAFICFFNCPVYADLTEKQGADVAKFAQKLIEKGNARKDKEGYPLMTYAQTDNWSLAAKIRNLGYNEKLYHVNNISYYKKNGIYKDLGNKWCMDCSTFVSYVYKVTLGLEMYSNGEPWRVQNMHNDALNKNSKYFYFVYKNTPISQINYSNLKLGDVITRVTSNGNHVMIYIGDGMIAHTNRDLITYKEPRVSGFTISKLEDYYSNSTEINVMRIKDGIVEKDYLANSKITWPDTGEEEYILGTPLNILNSYDAKLKSQEFLENSQKYIEEFFLNIVMQYAFYSFDSFSNYLQ